MPNWTDLCRLDEVPAPAQGGKYITVNGHILAVFRLPDGTIRVMDDRCPHAGGSLSAGHFDPELDCVMCPWHAWPFDPHTGQCPDNPSYAVRTYEAEIRDGRVWAKLGSEKTSNR